MRTLSPLVGAVLALAGASSAHANLLTNGSLETTARINSAGVVYASPSFNANALAGWTITSGTIDIVPASTWQAADGNFSVDMVGTPGPGSISQTVEAVAGDDYHLELALSFNPWHTPQFDEFYTTRTLQMQAIGADGHTVLATATYSGTVGTRTVTNMQYSTKGLDFTADGGQVTILISALYPTNLPTGLQSSNVRSGPVIDAVSLTALGGGAPNQVPEPASLSLLGLGGVLLLRRRR